MKNKLQFILITLLFTSCSTHFQSPITNTEYTGEISEKGISILAKPPGWDVITFCWEYITD